MTLVAIVAIGTISGTLLWVSGGLARMGTMSPGAIGGFLAAYLAAVWILGALKVWLVQARLWGKLVSSVTGLIEHLAEIGARRDSASAVGDDFASSYDFGAV